MSEPVTTVILVRHGHVEGITPPRFRGRTDLPLTDCGERQARALRDRIVVEWRPSAVYSSPLCRCLRTAGIVARPFGLVVEPVADLIDLDVGAWQGLDEEQVRTRWPEELARWHRTPHLVTLPEGESLQRVSARATRAVHDILRRHRGGNMVLVGHDSVNRLLLLHVLDLPLARYWSIAQAPCALNVLEYGGGRFVLRTLNETGHLIGS
jgi:broad specificity phosphatase PhoE